jgi:ArsR family transcriptional regulator
MEGEIVYTIKADFLKALAHPTRLKVIEFLKKGESNVSDMMKALDIEQSSLSRHLAVLKQNGVLKTKQKKTTIYYDIQDHDIFKVLRPIAEILRKKFKNAEVILNSLGKE